MDCVHSNELKYFFLPNYALGCSSAVITVKKITIKDVL